MAEVAVVGKVAAAIAPSTGKFLRGALQDRKRFDCLAGYLQTAMTVALAESSPAVQNAVPKDTVGRVVELALDRARAESDESAWYKSWKRVAGTLKHRTEDLSVRRTEMMQEVIARWIRAGLPPGEYDWRDLSERVAAGFRSALYAEHQTGTEPECLKFANELETKFQANDALWRVYDEKAQPRKAATVVAAGGVVTTTVLSALDLVDHNIDLLTGAGGVAGLSLIAVVWLAVRAHKEPRWDQAAALDLTLDTARDWLRNVREGHLKSVEARKLLCERVIPRLADWDVPVLVALLYRIADLVEDRELCRSSFTERQLEDLFRQATTLLQSPHQVDWAHKREITASNPVPDTRRELNG